MGKLRALKGNVRVRSREVFGDVKTRKKEILARMEEIDALELEAKRDGLKGIFVDLIRKESISWLHVWLTYDSCQTLGFFKLIDGLPLESGGDIKRQEKSYQT